jgi:hypothetical protein
MHLPEQVTARLTAYPGEHFLFAQYNHLPQPELAFEAHRDAVVAAMTRQLGRTQQSLRTPPDPALLRIQSWQYGFTDAPDDDGATRSFRDGVFLGLQGYRGDHLSSQRWRDYLAAFDRPELWLLRGREREEEGWLIEANACFAAARWLDPAVEPEIAELLGARDPRLPRRLLAQPDTAFPTRPFHKRHWCAWDMKNYGRLDLPTLLRWACDRNFSVRTRIYRSLGQRPHPAAIQALHEGTHDPHPFARAQAVRSLGWCADPTHLAGLRHLAADDPHPDVRRSAAKAVERILGFWTFYGEWNAIAASSQRLLAAARELADLGLRTFAWELTVRFGNAGAGQHPEIDALSDALEADIPEHEAQPSYAAWFAEAQASEATSASGEADAPGFEARRHLRWLGLPARPSGQR